MESKIKKLRKNFTAVMSANLFAMLVSILILIIVPRFFQKRLILIFNLKIYIVVISG